jgi:hypothetical protein
VLELVPCWAVGLLGCWIVGLKDLDGRLAVAFA